MMSDASPLDPADILKRVEEIQTAAHTRGDVEMLWLCHKLRTALADTLRVDWQPIETAKKGHEVLVWTGRERIVAHWAEHVEDHPPMTPGWYYWTGRMFDLVRPAPLLWMELPDKPSGAAMAATPRETT